MEHIDSDLREQRKEKIRKALSDLVQGTPIEVFQDIPKDDPNYSKTARLGYFVSFEKISYPNWIIGEVLTISRDYEHFNPIGSEPIRRVGNEIQMIHLSDIREVRVYSVEPTTTLTPGLFNDDIRKVEPVSESPG